MLTNCTIPLIGEEDTFKIEDDENQKKRTTKQRKIDDEETKKLVEEFLKNNQIKKCKTLFADGSRPTSGYYEF